MELGATDDGLATAALAVWPSAFIESSSCFKAAGAAAAALWPGTTPRFGCVTGGCEGVGTGAGVTGGLDAGVAAGGVAGAGCCAGT